MALAASLVVVALSSFTGPAGTSGSRSSALSTRLNGVSMAAVGRREAVLSLSMGAAALSAGMLPSSPAYAADTEASLIAEIKEIRAKLDLDALNAMLDEEKWDAVRSVWKVPPVNYAWEQSQNKKNPIKKLADLRDDVELFEVVDEIAAALQLADQYCYSNTFIYTQPGNGKVKIKEPKQQLKIAVEKIDSFIG